MSEPTIADTQPVATQLEAGKEYLFCTCGRSSDQPFCDNSHKGTPFKPKPFSVEESQEAYLCMCKRTADAPFCDGSHARLTKEEIREHGAATRDSAEVQPTPEEPTVRQIHELARHGLSKVGRHGEVAARHQAVDG